MRIDDGWLDIAKRCPSPNYNARPADAAIELLVIHNISLPAGHFVGDFIEQLFTNCLDSTADPSFCELEGLQVSAHLLYDAMGLLCSLCPLHLRAWHAGVSQWQARENCNDFSIGIELEGTDTTPYEDEQYQVLAKITRLLLETYPQLHREAITVTQILRQVENRPVPADWHYYRSLVG